MYIIDTGIQCFMNLIQIDYILLLIQYLEKLVKS